jgi:hypothetical protein
MPRSKKQDPQKKGGFIFPSNEIFQELLILDTLHDVNYADKSQLLTVFRPLISKLTPELKRLYLSSSYSFTKEAANHLLKKHPISFREYTSLKLNPEQIKFDKELVQRLKSITNNKTIKIIVDNFIASLQKDQEISDVPLCALGFAFLLIYLYNMNKIQPFNKDTIIQFIDGAFIKIDGKYMNRFLILWMRSVKRLSHVEEVILKSVEYIIQETEDPMVPIYFNNIYKQNVYITNQLISINSTEYPLYSSTSAIKFPHTKQEFYQYILKFPENKDLLHLNFLRDAFKADFAVNYDCLYVTHDRLAWIYYKFIGGNNGFFISVDKDVKNVVYKILY